MGQQGFLGEVRMFAGNFAPRGWAFCEGQLLSIAQNTALFSLLGTVYGGDGRTTFALPDLRGRAPISTGTGPGLPTYREGARSGSPTVVLNNLQMPSHNHPTSTTITGSITVSTNTEPSISREASGNTLGEAAVNIYNGDAAEAGEDLGGVSANLTATAGTNLSGNSQAHNNMQPYLSMYYIIATVGTFPSRT